MSPALPRPGAAWLCRGTNAWGTGLMAMDANQLPDSVIAGIEARLSGLSVLRGARVRACTGAREADVAAPITSLVGACASADLGRRGQRDDHGQPAAGGFLRFHRAAHSLGQPAGDREPEPHAGRLARVAESPERPERPVPVGFWNAGPAVDNTQLDPVTEGASRQLEGGPDRGVPERVADQVP